MTERLPAAYLTGKIRVLPQPPCDLYGKFLPSLYKGVWMEFCDWLAELIHPIAPLVHHHIQHLKYRDVPFTKLFDCLDERRQIIDLRFASQGVSDQLGCSVPVCGR